MSDKILEANMLGGFSLSYGGKEIVLDRNAVSKTTQLLQILLLNVKEGISKSGLIDALYGREDVENKNNSLNNTIFRLRKQLKAAGLPPSNFVIIQSGMCRWDSEIPVKVDALEFEKMVHLGEIASDEEEKAKCFQKACKLYTGEFLPSMIGEDWVTVQNVRYRDMYFTCADKLCKWLKDHEKFEEGYEVAKAAADIYPFEDWQVWQIDCLIAMARYWDAMEVYEATAKLMFEELGLAPSPEMLKRFRLMGERVSQASGAIGDIKQRLREKDRVSGAYYCTFPSFVDIYHVFSRMMERNGKSVYIMLCTLKKGRLQANGDDEKDRAVSHTLCKSIQNSLRRGDFFTRYNYMQYLVMLSEINQENCKIVSDRISGNFREVVKKEYSIDFYVASIAEICPEDEQEQRRFREDGQSWKRGENK